MFWSRNSFFKKTHVELLIKKSQIHTLLSIKGRSKEEINDYAEAYNYFMLHPDKFDGATIVKDLDDIPNLDLDAMVHDYEYIAKGANKNFIKKWKSDFKYLKNCEKNGKGLRIIRFILLTITGIVFVPYNLIK